VTLAFVTHDVEINRDHLMFMINLHALMNTMCQRILKIFGRKVIALVILTFDQVTSKSIGVPVFEYFYETLRPSNY
jgi:hypothetical protein